MRVTVDKIKELQKKTKQIRNVCILAHVDHGKTTLADTLISSNGLISQKLAGKLRYMDSRQDEQLRGITMKSSAICLHYPEGPENEYLINLIDSPGHIDFTGEVSAVVRLCDGAIVLVDVMEGVCAQTKAVLRQAWLEGLRVVLVLNKVDRLVLEVNMHASEAVLRLMQIVEQVNAFIAELVASQVYATAYQLKKDSAHRTKDCFHLEDWQSGMEELEDSHFYFSPDQGNVVFASASDGWGFRLCKFAELYSGKLEVEKGELLRGLWGDHYLDGKRTVRSGAKGKGKKCLFEQLVLENIWKVYEAVFNDDTEMTEKIIAKLGVSVKLRASSDHRTRLKTILSQWLPLTSSVLGMVVQFVPSPQDLPIERIDRFICNNDSEEVPEETLQLKKAFQKCASGPHDPLVIFISKLLPFQRKDLPQHKNRPLTLQQIADRRECLRWQMMTQQTTAAADVVVVGDNNNNNNNNNGEVAYNNSKNSNGFSVSLDNSDVTGNDKKDNNENNSINNNKNNNHEDNKDDHVFVGFGRVFSGEVRRGVSVYLLSPKHKPACVPALLLQLKDTQDEEELLRKHHIHKVTVRELYILMGRELEEVDCVSAGNILGIGGLERVVLRTACLSDTLFSPSYSDLVAEDSSIVRVAVEPLKPADMSAFLEGLRLLEQSDPCVSVEVEDSGEHVLVAAGEVHLNKCLDDLKERFAKIEVCVSAPTVAFRETIVCPPLVDRVNEAVVGGKKETSRCVEFVTAEGWFLRVKAVPMPAETVEVLEGGASLLRQFSMKRSCYSANVKNPKLLADLRLLRDRLGAVFDGVEGWQGWVHKVWSIDLSHECTNVLFNHLPTYQRPSFFDLCLDQSLESSLLDNDQAIINGFELASKAGPICEEPLYGVAFVLQAWHKVENPEDFRPKAAKGALEDVEEEEEAEEDAQFNDNYTDREKDKEKERETEGVIFYRGILMGAMRNCCQSSFQRQPQRLMWAVYSCSILATKKILGKMYAVLSKRHGRVLSEEMLEGSSLFRILSILPIIESFGFAEEFRKKTSGMAVPQFKFSHWETIDIDPFWVPTTEEEYMHFGEKADCDNVALKYMNDVRRRKGLKVMEKLVEFGDKQRTLSKNK